MSMEDRVLGRLPTASERYFCLTYYRETTMRTDWYQSIVAPAFIALLADVSWAQPTPEFNNKMIGQDLSGWPANPKITQ